MSLNESMTEEAALAMPRAALTPAFSQREMEEEREANPRLNPAMGLMAWRIGVVRKGDIATSRL
jgi:hypothetical protein